jgi:hypothetical protein
MDERAERLEKRIKELEKIDSSDSETDDGDEQISNLAVSGQQQAHIEVSKY